MRASDLEYAASLLRDDKVAVDELRVLLNRWLDTSKVDFDVFVQRSNSHPESTYRTETHSLQDPAETTEHWSRPHAGASYSTWPDTTGKGTEIPKDRFAAERFGARYSKLHHHASGGLGNVYLAHDREVNRPVAFKEMKSQFVGDDSSRTQFILEAQITGGLQHPGIVPIYGLGIRPDGSPYYAMRFITGESLDVAIKRFHEIGNERSAPLLKLNQGDRMLDLRQLLSRFVSVCQAMAYAHSRGIVHRDLKPMNIMLGRYSETLVIDWGLARMASQASEGLNLDLDTPLKASFAGGSGKAFEISGTPAFMSPEQARGNVSSIGPASDIYSLGATLYSILVGHAPFPESEPVQKKLERVVRSDFRPPIALVKDIPPALNAIVMHAMAPQPENRYANAEMLANDIERWLGDEAVSVYRGTALERTSRWARKNRIKVSLGAGAILASLAASLVTVVLLTQEQSRTEKQRVRADSMFRQARQAVDDYLIRVVDSDRLKSKSLEPVRLSLLQDGLEYYERFLDNSSMAPELATSRAEALLSTASIRKEMGAWGSAIEQFEIAFQACEAVFRDAAPSSELIDKYAKAHVDLAEIYVSSPNTRELSKSSLEKARSIYEGPKAVDPASRAAGLARVHTVLGRWFKESDAGQVLDHLKQSVTHRTEQLRLQQDSTVKSLLAQSQFDYAIALSEARRWTDAIDYFSQARAIWLELQNEDAFRDSAVEASAALAHELAILEMNIGAMETAQRESELALRERSRLVFQLNNQHLAPLAQTMNDHGLRLLSTPEGLESGRELIRRALWLRKELLAWSPSNHIELSRFLESVNNLASHYLDLEDTKAADDILSMAQSRLENTPVEVLSLPSVVKYTSTTDRIRARCRYIQEDLPGFEDSIRAAINKLTAIVQADPNNHEFLLTLMLTYGDQGNLLLDADKSSDAYQAFLEAEELGRRLTELSPEDPKAKVNYAGCLLSTAVAQRSSEGDVPMVGNRLRTSLRLTREVSSTASHLPEIQPFLLMEILQAISYFEAIGELSSSMDFLLECVQDRCMGNAEIIELASALAESVETSIGREAVSKEEREKLLAGIVQMLRIAKERGELPPSYRTASIFNLVSNREDFRQLFDETTVQQ
jgi:serine/threonine protein kinase/tetratricopeptide (TPR) repeat protein